jgi:hypothetical protein
MKVAWCTLLLALHAPAQPEQPRLVRIDDHIYRGRQPKQAQFAALAEMGIHTVLGSAGRFLCIAAAGTIGWGW